MVGFPGLGISAFKMDGIAFSIGNFSIHWYGIIIAVGFLLAAIYVCKRAPQFNYSADDMIDMLIFAVPLAIIGARVYFVAFNWDNYKNDLLSVFRIWDGGIAIYGAVIFAVITCALFCWVKHINIGAMLDLGALGLLIGQAIGRWGNFVNIEVFGTETALPWRMTVYDTAGNLVGDVHPLFLYESLWNVLGFVLLHFLSKKRKFNGQVMLLYVAWYGLGRGFLEGLRVDDFALTIGTVRVSQILGFASCIVALVILAYQLIFKTHEPEDLSAWAVEREKWKQERIQVKASVSSGVEAYAGEDRDDGTEAGEEPPAGEAGGVHGDTAAEDSSQAENDGGDGETKEE